jgi:hypothetical protein
MECGLCRLRIIVEYAADFLVGSLHKELLMRHGARTKAAEFLSHLGKHSRPCRNENSDRLDYLHLIHVNIPVSMILDRAGEIRCLDGAHIVEELLVVAGLGEFVGEEFHGFDRGKRVEDATENPGALKVFL